MFAVRVAHASTGIAMPRFSLYSSTSAVMYRARTCKSPTRPAVVSPMLSSSRYTFFVRLWAIRVPAVARRSAARTTPSLQTRPSAATSYDMSDLDRRSCGLVIRISSPGRRRADIQQQALHASGGPQLNRIRNLLFRKCHIRGTHVDGNPVTFFLGAQDLIPRNRDHLPPFLVLEEVADGTRHRAQLHEEETRIIRVAVGRGRKEEQSGLVAEQG